ncbi:MAG: 4Fe-4S binding protein [Ruminococcus sp.]|uniref:4Fe-4S binding protein n=1 Tax=Ruminococcus sp. TaxID=41978 RepID=UPI0025F24E92|nr:4Fe-4S binding protein [Ruminococcus sp.]MBR5684194.1 4Fe-4S binding protein [Ruminococcus sp.]
MTVKDYLAFIVEQIHSTVIATVDEDCLPVTCVIDMMYADENGLYFLTAKGKNFYQRLKDKSYLALSGKKGEDTMSCTAVSVRGKVREIGQDMLPLLFEKNPYMLEIYPTEESRKALTVFQIYEGSGEWFDLSKKPIERDSFIFGGAENKASGYFVTDDCIACGSCLADCPQNCIALMEKAVIRQENCLHCGNCEAICPVGAVVKR